jgi:hypothetical protein
MCPLLLSFLCFFVLRTDLVWASRLCVPHNSRVCCFVPCFCFLHINLPVVCFVPGCVCVELNHAGFESTSEVYARLNVQLVLYLPADCIFPFLPTQLKIQILISTSDIKKIHVLGNIFIINIAIPLNARGSVVG